MPANSRWDLIRRLRVKYLGAMVNIDSSIKEEIKERITAGNKAYHVHKKLFTSKLISRNVKLHL